MAAIVALSTHSWVGMCQIIRTSKAHLDRYSSPSALPGTQDVTNKSRHTKPLLLRP
jgi:hypothetical protein